MALRICLKYAKFQIPYLTAPIFHANLPVNKVTHPKVYLREIQKAKPQLTKVSMLTL